MEEFVLQIPKETLNAYKGIYQVSEMNEARKNIIEALYNTRSYSKIELTSKLKCGVLTSDVIDYFVHGYKESINNYDGFEIEENKKTCVVDQREETSIAERFNEKEEGEIDEFDDFAFKTKNQISNLEPPVEIIDNVTEIILCELNESINNQEIISQELINMRHECENNCKKNISNFKPKYSKKNLILEVVFVCDICSFTSHDQKMTCFHIDQLNHISASVYLREKSFLANKSNLKYIVSRSSFKSLQNSLATGVFCPNRECSFFFGFDSTSILSCGLHYQYFHNSDKQIFSAASLKNESAFEMNKVHECPSCKLVFKKLSNLAKHLKESGHFPQSSSNEICLLICPVDNCKFKSIHIHAFKMHVLNHSGVVNLFKEQVTVIQNEPKVNIRVLIYKVNSCYSHFPQIKKTSQDYEHELKAVANLLDLNKWYMHLPKYVDYISWLTQRQCYLRKKLNQ